MNLKSCMIWLRGLCPLSKQSFGSGWLEVGNIYLELLWSILLSGRGQRIFPQHSKTEGRVPQVSQKEVQENVNVRVYFMIVVLGEFNGEYSLYTRLLPAQQRLFLLFLCFTHANWNFFPTISVKVFRILKWEIPLGKSWASTQHVQLPVQLTLTYTNIIYRAKELRYYVIWHWG